MSRIKTNLLIGNIMGIPIIMNYSWFIVFALLTWVTGIYKYNISLPHLNIMINIMLGAFTVILFFVSIVAHELAHSSIAMKSGIKINKITLFIFGGVAVMEKEPSDPTTEFRMALAGPVTSFILALAFYSLSNIASNFGLPIAIAMVFATVSEMNIYLAIFNLIPGFPLDGGRILRSAIWSLNGNVKYATALASQLGKMFAFFIVGLGIIFLLYGNLILGIWYIIIGYFLLEAANSSYEQFALKKDLSGIKVKDIMNTNVITVNDDIPLLTLIDDYFFKYRFTTFPVINNDGALTGLITINTIKDIPRNKWVDYLVMDAMLPIKKELIVEPLTELYEALALMAGNGIGRLLVLGPKGNLIGIISQRDVIRLFKVKEELS